jgi:hypothetical protein
MMCLQQKRDVYNPLAYDEELHSSASRRSDDPVTRFLEASVKDKCLGS